MTTIQAVVLAFIQGLTELFPISSLGHAVLAPRLLNWPIDLHSPEFLPFLTVMHLGTAVALFLYFWRDWRDFLLSLVSAGSPASAANRKLFLLVVLATIPAVIVGFAFRKLFGEAFATPVVAAVFLIANGFVLFVGDRVASSARGELTELNWKGALTIGVAQCFALVPGISRSGATIVMGLLAGLKHEAAARFSFLMATPIIVAATVSEAPKLMHSGATMGGVSVISGVVAGVVAYASLVFLMRYFKTNEVEALNPFAYYCWGAGALSLLAMAFLL
jgi:undecaprenyl-diphosphatase